MLSVRALEAWNGLVPEWIGTHGETWLSRGAAILNAPGLGRGAEEVAVVPLPSWKRIAAESQLSRRLLRLACYNVVPLHDGRLLVSFGKSLLLHGKGRWSEIGGLVRPFRILRGCCALTPDGDVYFGEYFPNDERAAPVNVYRLAAGASTAEIVWTFRAGEVRHVHGVHWDQQGRALWVLTGDLPAECRILKTTDRFATLETVGAGDESWRAIYPVFTADSIYYATDSEFRDNFIYRLDRATGQRDMLTGIDGPSYYGAQVACHAVFATTVELCPSQKGKDAVIWAIDRAHRPHRIAAYRKDLLGSRHMIPLFQAGIVQFPAGPGGTAASACPFTGSGLAGLDGRMHALALQGEG